MRLDEFIARCLAARKLDSIDDPHGLRLPFEVWRFYLPDAEFFIGALTAFDLQQTLDLFYRGDDEAEV